MTIKILTKNKNIDELCYNSCYIKYFMKDKTTIL
jgi:hypothetical protein